MTLFMIFSWSSAVGRLFWKMQTLSPVDTFFTSLHYQKKKRNRAISARTYSIATDILSDSAMIRSCSCSKALFPTHSVPCTSWLICTYQAFSSVDRRLYTLFLCWSRLGFCRLTWMLVITNSNEGMQRERIYSSNDYGTLKKNIHEQSVKIHIHACSKNAKKIQEHLHIKSWHSVNLKRA